MILINFAHPTTPNQDTELERLAKRKIERKIERQAQFDAALPFSEQARALVASVGLTSAEWQTLPLIVNLPSLNVIAALLLAELHGRAGYFPTIVRLRPIAGAVPPQFEVAEVVNLQSVRDRARGQR